MSHFEAWQWIFSRWNSPTWIRIDENVKKVLHLDTRLGMCSGMLVTVNGSKGQTEFIERLNKKQLS